MLTCFSKLLQIKCLPSLTKCDRDGINHHIGRKSDCGESDPFRVSLMHEIFHSYDLVPL